jgi:hypothetical protein
MQMLWCWRCKAELPMLNEEEYAEMWALYGAGMQATKESREECFRPFRMRYQELTGMAESNHNAIMHHRLSLYGLPCARCKKPLRTPKAKLCGACMFPVERSNTTSD